MLQFNVWTALALEGMGASLQHYTAYSPEVSANVLKEFDLPTTWKCTAMMPFGVPTGEPGNPSRPKTFIPAEERVKVFFE
jgi:predicted oxidoreductase (fatty acid repression mutant protein)